jgi:cytochrome c-type biogenesis protein CcmF
LFLPLAGLLLLILMVGHETRWRKTGVAHLFKGQRWQWLVSLAITGALLSWLESPSIPQALFALLSLNVLVGLARQWGARAHLRGRWRALLEQSTSYYSMLLGHVGLVIAVIGIAATSISSIEQDLRMAPGDEVQVGDYAMRLTGVGDVEGPNYTAERGEVVVTRDGQFVARLFPEKRRYHASQMVMTEAAIDAGLSRDLYVALGEPLGDGAWSVRMQVKPLVRWIWLGGVMIALSGLVSLLDLRYRKRAIQRAQVANESLAPLSQGH